MRRAVRAVIAAAGLAGGLVLAACAGPTPYQAALESGYGYAEQRVERDRFLVSFSGNALTDRETVETFLLYRAAELTLQENYDYFTVVRRDTESETRIYDTGLSRFDVRYRYYHPIYGWYGWRDPFWDDVDLRESTRYEAMAEIVLGRGETPDDPDAFDAREVVDNLEDQVVRPEEG